MRFAVTARKNGHEVKVFLMGEAVEIESLHHEKFDVAAQVEAFHEAGGEILACCQRRFDFVVFRQLKNAGKQRGGNV